MQKVEIKLPDRTVAKAQQNKMADSLGESDDILIENFMKENTMNKNTLQSTNNWVKVRKSSAAYKG